MPDPQMHHTAFRRTIWVLSAFAILSHTFLYALDNTIVANTRPPIIATLGGIEKLPWISVGYALGEVGSNPIWGNLYGRFDNKILLCVAIVIFDVGSALCGAAPTPDVLIAGRVIAGLGGSGIYIGTLNMFTALTLMNERALYLSMVGIAWCLGTILGPIIGGAFADSTATWRWSFYLNLCISGATAPVILLCLPLNPSKITKRAVQQFCDFDFIGAGLYVASALTLIMAMSFGGIIWPWNNGRIIALLVLASVFWTSFAFQQRFSWLTTPESRIFPVQFCGEAEMCNLFAQTAIGISCVIIPIYFIPLFLQYGRAQSAFDAGVHTLPFIASAVVALMVQGALFEKFSFYLPWFTLGGVLAAVGLGLLTTLHPSISNAKLYGFSVLAGFGAATYAQVGYAVGQSKHPERVAQVTAFLSCAQMGGVALSLSIGTAIFVNGATKGISIVSADSGLDGIQITSLLAGTESDILNNLDVSTQVGVVVVLAKALRSVFIMGTVAAGCGAALSFFLKPDRVFPSNSGRQDESIDQ